MLDVVDFYSPKTPCQTPGCDWPSFHICLVGKEDKTEEVLKKGIPSGGSTNMQMASKERWAAHKEAMRERDANIVQMYQQESVSMKMIQEELGVSRNTVINVLREAQKAGKVKIRRPGHTIKNGAK